MAGKGKFKVEMELTKSARDKLVVDLTLRNKTATAAAREIGIADHSVHRWFKNLPEDEKMRLVAADAQRKKVAQTREAAKMIVSDGDDIDNDLRWLLNRLRTAIEACDNDEKLLELAQMREMRHTLESLAKIRGMFNNKIDVTIDLGSSPQFLVLRKIILEVLERHVDAKVDFLQRMRELNIVEDAQVIEHVAD